MRRRTERGFLMLPVALVVAVAGALSWAAVRASTTRLAAVDAEYDTEVARYLAEAGLNLAAWQSEKLGCGCTGAFSDFSLPGGSVSTNSVVAQPGGILADVASRTPQGGSVRLRRWLPNYDRGERKDKIVDRAEFIDDSYIKAGDTIGRGTLKIMELAEGVSHGVLSYRQHKDIPAQSLVVFANLEMKGLEVQNTGVASQPVYLHRVTTGWEESKVNWTSPWKAAGGDYTEAPVAVVDVRTDKNLSYFLRLDGLADGWFHGRIPAYGLLLRTSGPHPVRFKTIEDAGFKIKYSYYLPCP